MRRGRQDWRRVVEQHKASSDRDHKISEEARRFLFCDAPRWIGAILTCPPVFLYLFLTLVGVTTMLLAKWAGVASVPTPKGNFGFALTLNWSVMFVFGLPWLFSHASQLNRRCLPVLRELSDPAIGIIQTDKGLPARHYLAWIAGWQKRQTVLRLVASFLLATVIVGSDFYAIWGRYDSLRPNGNDQLYAALFRDHWTVAWIYSPLQISKLGNRIFFVWAYAIQFVYIFLGFFWGFSFWRFLRGFSIPVLSKLPFRLDLWLEDREDRLGLGSLGALFTGFLRIAVAFLFYVAVFTFFSTAWQQGKTEWQYLREVLGLKQSAINLVTKLDLDPKFAKDLSQQGEQIMSGLLAAKLAGIMLVAILVYVPLIVLRGYLQGQLETLRRENRRLYKAAQDALLGFDPAKATDAAQAALAKLSKEKADANLAELERRWAKLEKAEVWPCGNATALRYFTYMGLLAIAILLPAFGVLLIFGIVAGTVLRKLLPLLPSFKG